MTTDPRPVPLSDDDPLDASELALHAVLDGEATPEQRRLVAGDVELRQRLEELRAVADMLDPEAEDDEVDDATLARLRATAITTALDEAAFAPGGTAEVADLEMAALDERDDDAPDDDDERKAEESAAPSTVTPLAPRRPLTTRRLPPLPAVAAVVVVLMAIGLGLILTSGDEAESTASEAPSAQEAEDSAAPAEGGSGAVVESGDVPAADAGAPTTTAEEFSADEALVSYPDEEALRRALTGVDPATIDAPGVPASGSRASAADEDAVARCDQVLRAADPAVQPAQASRRVLLDGTEVVILSNPVEATETEPANTRLTVLEPVGCIPLFAVQR